VEILRANEIDIARCNKGSGYGSSAARGAQKVAEAGVEDSAQELWNEILRRVGGDTEAGSQLLREITANPPKFAGFKTIARLTQKWQVSGAMDKLKKHEMWGDEAMRGAE